MVNYVKCIRLVLRVAFSGGSFPIAKATETMPASQRRSFVGVGWRFQHVACEKFASVCLVPHH